MTRRTLTAAERLARFGPTVGDRVRLGDTDLWLRVEEDRQAGGIEPIWGYGKTFRSGIAQWDHAGDSQLDAVVVGALVVDPLLGVIKADIGIKEGRIVGVGRAGNPETTDGVDLPVGPHTNPISAYGLIATAGAVDTHVHLITPRVLPAALSGGVTTFITAGFEEPPWAMARTVESLEAWPINVGMQACARARDGSGLDELIDAGVVGFKVHEDYGAYPDVIDGTLAFAEAADVSVSLHTDGLHESAELEDTIAAIAGRTVHAYHVEGTGGGHVPDLIELVRERHIICSSTTPTVPWGLGAVPEHLPMTILNHGASFGVAEDVALVEERIHPATMAAEGPLHELGGIAIINSDSQGMGRIGETVRRTFQLAHAMKAWRASALGAEHAPHLPEVGTAEREDNARVLRYLAKVTIEPAITHGIAAHVGTLAVGRLADIVLWKPSFFGAKPELVLKAGFPAWGPLGEGNASVERAEPTLYGADWGGAGSAPPSVSVTFTSRPALESGYARLSRTRREVIAVERCRGLSRADLALNRAAPAIEVDPRDGTVMLDSRVLRSEPLDDVPLSRRYFLR